MGIALVYDTNISECRHASSLNQNLGDASFQACDQIRITSCYISM